MRIWDGEKCVENLSHEALVVLGLLWMKVDVDTIVGVLGDGEPRSRRYAFVSWLRSTRQRSVVQCRLNMPQNLTAEIKGGVRCPRCGAMVNVVPCRACMLAGRATEDKEDKEEWAARPTDAIPGTIEKIRVLARRAARGEPLWHPRDRHLTGKSTDEFE